MTLIEYLAYFLLSVIIGFLVTWFLLKEDDVSFILLDE